MTCEHVTSVLITYCEIPVPINSIDVMGITRLADHDSSIYSECYTCIQGNNSLYTTVSKIIL